jgi:hypothetical protein
VADSDNHRIQKFDSSGNFISVLLCSLEVYRINKKPFNLQIQEHIKKLMPSVFSIEFSLK